MVGPDTLLRALPVLTHQFLVHLVRRGLLLSPSYSRGNCSSMRLNVSSTTERGFTPDARLQERACFSVLKEESGESLFFNGSLLCYQVCNSNYEWRKLGHWADVTMVSVLNFCLKYTSVDREPAIAMEVRNTHPWWSEDVFRLDLSCEHVKEN